MLNIIKDTILGKYNTTVMDKIKDIIPYNIRKNTKTNKLLLYLIMTQENRYKKYFPKILQAKESIIDLYTYKDSLFHFLMVAPKVVKIIDMKTGKEKKTKLINENLKKHLKYVIKRKESGIYKYILDFPRLKLEPLEFTFYFNKMNEKFRYLPIEFVDEMSMLLNKSKLSNSVIDKYVISSYKFRDILKKFSIEDFIYYFDTQVNVDKYTLTVNKEKTLKQYFINKVYYGTPIKMIGIKEKRNTYAVKQLSINELNVYYYLNKYDKVLVLTKSKERIKIFFKSYTQDKPIGINSLANSFSLNYIFDLLRIKNNKILFNFLCEGIKILADSELKKELEREKDLEKILIYRKILSSPIEEMKQLIRKNKKELEKYLMLASQKYVACFLYNLFKKILK